MVLLAAVVGCGAGSLPSEPQKAALVLCGCRFSTALLCAPRSPCGADIKKISAINDNGEKKENQGFGGMFNISAILSIM